MHWRRKLFKLASFLIIYSGLSSALQFPWLNIATVGINHALRSPDHCDSLIGLVPRQRNICRKHIDFMSSVRLGAKMSIDECQNQFKYRRWNCSTVDARTVFGPVMNLGTRETAFVYAISSAGVAWAVTKACTAGQLRQCGCDKGVKGAGDGFEWAGCSDNIGWGVAFSSRFVDARERPRKKVMGERAMMNLQNNIAGRKTIEETMRVECKCHGVSGSCEMRTCWRKLAHFREIGDRLKQKFDGATEVVKKELGRERFSLEPRNGEYKHHTMADLVYLVPSPDYCESDAKSGSLGTVGRLCNRTSPAIDGCDLLCCGRGFQTTKRVVQERCFCKFYWCCHVRCKKCERQIEENRCL